jgi:hypothetical protein
MKSSSHWLRLQAVAKVDSVLSSNCTLPASLLDASEHCAAFGFFFD